MPPLRAAVHDYLRRGWSPEEIAGTLKREHLDLEHMQTSHESICRYVYVVARGELQRELTQCLRRKHRTRKPRRRGVATTQGKIPDMVLVDERPPEVENRLVAGHYEADLILGAGNRSAVGVIVERTSRFTMLCHLPAKDATSVREAFTRRLRSIPLPLRKTLTYDQGKEMAQHQTLAADLSLKIFFCHPHSPWERATCESVRTTASDTTCPKEPTYQRSPTSNSQLTRKCSTNVPEKSSTGSPLPSASMISL